MLDPGQLYQIGRVVVGAMIAGQTVALLRDLGLQLYEAQRWCGSDCFFPF